MMQILNNSGGDISQLTERVEVLEEEVPVIAGEVVQQGNRITALEDSVFETTTTVNLQSPSLSDRVAITSTNFPELYENLNGFNKDKIKVTSSIISMGSITNYSVYLYKSKNTEGSIFSNDYDYFGLFTNDVTKLWLLSIVITDNKFDSLWSATYSLRRLDVIRS